MYDLWSRRTGSLSVRVRLLPRSSDIEDDLRSIGLVLVLQIVDLMLHRGRPVMTLRDTAEMPTRILVHRVDVEQLHDNLVVDAQTADVLLEALEVELMTACRLLGVGEVGELGVDREVAEPDVVMLEAGFVAD